MTGSPVGRVGGDVGNRDVMHAKKTPRQSVAAFLTLRIVLILCLARRDAHEEKNIPKICRDNFAAILQQFCSIAIVSALCLARCSVHSGRRSGARGVTGETDHCGL